MRIILGSMLALVLASCPTLAPLASAQTAERHACCSPQPDEAQGPDCCLRAAAQSSAVLVAPQFVAAAVGVERALPAEVAAFRPDSAALSPPDEPSPHGRSSRAPPSFLA